MCIRVAILVLSSPVQLEGWRWLCATLPLYRGLHSAGCVSGFHTWSFSLFPVQCGGRSWLCATICGYWVLHSEGCASGSTLGLFLLFINNLPSCTSTAKLSLFADGTSRSVSSPVFVLSILMGTSNSGVLLAACYELIYLPSHLGPWNPRYCPLVQIAEEGCVGRLLSQTPVLHGLFLRFESTSTKATINLSFPSTYLFRNTNNLTIVTHSTSFSKKKQHLISNGVIFFNFAP